MAWCDGLLLMTTQCLRASTEKDSTTGGSVAVRDFNPAYGTKRGNNVICRSSGSNRASICALYSRFSVLCLCERQPVGPETSPIR